MSDPFALDDDAPTPPPAQSNAPRPGGIAARALAAASPSAQYLQGLNSEQRAAVETIDGPVLVLAGAGTGKTRVLTTRIAHIIAERRAFPSQLLAVTFTNKAAREMKLRIGALLGAVAEGMPWLGTFHSIGTKILRRHAELVNLKPDFTILDTDDQLRLLKQVMKADDIDEKRWPARALASTIDGWKNRGLTPQKIPNGEAEAFANGRGRKLYTDYQARLKALNAADFGDLLLECIRLFQENQAILSEYQDRFRFMLVDEYQDTNVAQYLWLRLLAQKRDDRPQNICCVGDDDQSIYGWRGAEVDNILRFDKDFPGAKVVRLERNYRSTAHILAAASGLITRNEDRLGKTLFTDGDEGHKVTVSGAWDSEEEARLVGDEIEALQTKSHTLNEIAILVRASFQMREFEERFITLGVPYRVIGGPRFYERKEVRDALAYMRIVHQPADDLAFERIINVPKRGIGDATVAELYGYARREQIPLTRAVRVLVETEELKPRVRQTLRDLINSFDRWAGLIETQRHNEAAETILEESGYVDMLKQDRSADAAGRLENLKEFTRSMEQFDTLQSFLEHVSLVMEAAQGDSDERVTIMTLHAAKGLEFETVFLPGWEEGLFPHPRALDEQGRSGLEEERRLAYVGLTRAKERAKIYFASNRRIHGSWNASIPSRFLDELPESNVEVMVSGPSFAHGRGGYTGGGNFGGGNAAQSRFDRMAPFQGSSYTTPGWQRAQQRGTTSPGSQGPAQPLRGSFSGGDYATSRKPVMIEGEVLARSDAAQARFATGARVFHLKFGNGSVAAVDGNKLTVDFDKSGRKMVLDSYLEAG